MKNEDELEGRAPAVGAALAGSPLVTLVVLAGLLATAIAWLLVYSYLVWRNDPQAQPPAGTRPA